jgi:hypothetical protein
MLALSRQTLLATNYPTTVLSHNPRLAFNR